MAAEQAVMRRRRLAVAAGVALVVGAFALWTTDATRRSAPEVALPAPPTRVQREPPAPPGSNADRFPGRGGRRVQSALDRQIAAAGLTGRISDDDRAALLAALAGVRRSARRARRRTRTDPVADAAHARTVVDADRLFREKLGVGIAGFIAAQGPPSRIEDLGTIDPAPER